MKWKILAAAALLIVVSAIPVASQTLTVSVTGSGKVTGTGIDCPSDCSEALPPPPPLSPVKGATVRSRATVVLAAGTPVVLPELSAFPEIVNASGGGVLFSPGENEGDFAKNLAEALKALLRDPEKCSALGEAARAAAEREFSMTRLAERLVELTRSSVG